MSAITPGRKNSVSVDYSNTIQLSIQPNPFSPDGDGFEDEAVFSYTLPAESNLTIKIYDVKGRLVRTLVRDESRASGELAWDGKDNDSQTVRIGIYVVWAEVTGNSRSQAKRTVVVARRQ
jgi:flagellar hook assembly protein FlgD